tara:strand:+ start:15532 stop:15783 length:252 start_codon:yes stop_codon:yes gene_type:complete
MSIPDPTPIPVPDPSSQYVPKFGYWRHKKTNNLYEIIAFAIEEMTMIPVVVYKCEGPVSSSTWTRPCSEFFEIARFEQVDNAW